MSEDTREMLVEIDGLHEDVKRLEYENRQLHSEIDNLIEAAFERAKQDMATRDDVARLANQLMSARNVFCQISEEALSQKPDIGKIGVLCFDVLNPTIALSKT